MPFSIETKTELFIRLSRLCCLCLKQCGTNIEAAHIVDEGKGGSNDSDNGIPFCFDCHQDVGAYNDLHPKGNKFRPEELKARRDRVFTLVESGVIYAQLISHRVRSSGRTIEPADIDDAAQPEKPRAEAVRFLNAVLSAASTPHAGAQKIGLLSAADRAFVLDELSRAALENPRAMSIIVQLVGSPGFPEAEADLLMEQNVRALTLFGTVQAKAEFLNSVPTEGLNRVYDGLRQAFFADIIGIIKQDQFDEVNLIVPAVIDQVSVIPPELYTEYVFSLLRQARSMSYKGAPAARRGLAMLPPQVAKTALDSMDVNFLFWESQYGAMREFARKYKDLADDSKREIFEDLATLNHRDFIERHIPEDLY